MTDAHCHLQNYSDIEVEVQRCKVIGVTRLICAGFDIESSKKAIEIASSYPEVFATVGIHPDSKDNFSEIKNLVNQPKVIAIGECGLDYSIKTNDSDRELQQKLLLEHVKLANDVNLPLVIHNRNADEDILKIVNCKLKIGVMMHCFTGDMDFMKESVGRGWYISFGGILTFKKSEYLRDVAKLVPDDKLLIETDSPYLSPTPIRNKQNQPKNVKIVAELLASIRNTSINQIEEITDRNAERLFNIPLPA